MSKSSGPIPVEVLFKAAERTMPRLSPEGTSLAHLTRASGAWNIWVGPVGGPTERLTRSDNDIINYRWSFDGVRILYLNDSQGDENWRLFSVNTKTGETVDLTPFDGIYAHIIRLSKSRPTEALVAINLDDKQIHDVYRVDIATGELTLEARNPGNVSAMQPDQPAWFADGDLRIRACVAARDDGAYNLLVRSPDEDDWRTLLTWEFEDSRNSRPLSIHPSGRSIFLIDSRTSDTGRVVEVDLQSGETSLLAEDPTYDATDVLFDPETGEPIAIVFSRERREWQALDANVAADFEALSAAFKGDLDVFPASSRHWIFEYVADDDPGGYLAYDRETRRTSLLFEGKPELMKYELAKTEPFNFTASDGLSVHGYLTFPPGGARKTLPMVLFVHGGPWARDHWGFREEVQFLASRGYMA